MFREGTHNAFEHFRPLTVLTMSPNPWNPNLLSSEIEITSHPTTSRLVYYPSPKHPTIFKVNFILFIQSSGADEDSKRIADMIM
jgi:hypothetical protein